LVKTKCKAALNEISKGDSFSEIYEKYSSKGNKDGLNVWIFKNDKRKTIVNSAYSIKYAGQNSGVTYSDTGCSIITLKKKRQKGFAKIDDVRGQIIKILQKNATQQSFTEKLTEIREHAEIVVH